MDFTKMFDISVALDESQYFQDDGSLIAPLRFSDEIHSIDSPTLELLLKYVRQHIVPENANSLYDRLWLAGRTCNLTRTLTEFRARGNNFVVTNDINMHLVWDHPMMHIKPLPSWCTNYSIVSAIQTYGPYTDGISENINGFLFSYSRLVKTRHDFEIAKESSLITPADLSWDKWSAFMYGIQFTDPQRMPGRYRYGALRLNRLNLIKQTSLKHFGLYYHSKYPNYETYFGRYIQVSFILFAFMSILLSCAQVIFPFDNRPLYYDWLLYYIAVLFFWGTISIVIAIAVIFLAVVGWFIKFVTRHDN